ncbi:MAG: AlpA family phage regulatory protein [Rhodospirillaceae bacterium]|nr:AlpA family phage regulatory protein [Rhodospirillaceae bacterium]
MSDFANDRMVPIRRVAELTGLHRTTIYRLIKKGKFPPPYKVGERASRWPENVIREWVRGRPQGTFEIGHGPVA